MLPAPENPSLGDHAWAFLQSPASCVAALVCLLGGLICASGIGSANWRLTLLGVVLMLPYALPAALLLLTLIPALLFFGSFALWEFQIKPFLRKLRPK